MTANGATAQKEMSVGVQNNAGGVAMMGAATLQLPTAGVGLREQSRQLSLGGQNALMEAGLSTPIGGSGRLQSFGFGLSTQLGGVDDKDFFGSDFYLRQKSDNVQFNTTTTPQAGY
jgi:c-di-GMP-binding flagellar brake protein YcgR